MRKKTVAVKKYKKYTPVFTLGGLQWEITKVKKHKRAKPKKRGYH